MPFTDALLSPIYHNIGYETKVEGLFCMVLFSFSFVKSVTNHKNDESHE